MEGKFLARFCCFVKHFCVFASRAFEMFMSKIKLRAQIFIESLFSFECDSKICVECECQWWKKCERSTKISTEISTSHKSILEWSAFLLHFFPLAVDAHYFTLLYLYPLISNIMLILVMNFWFSTSRNCRFVKLKWFAFTFLRNSHENCHD